MTPLDRFRLDSPLGAIAIAVAGDDLYALDFIESDPDRPPRVAAPPPESARPGRRARRIADRVLAYFGGDIRALDDIAVAPAGTAFQLRVWAALRRIPPGETRSYHEVALAVGAPSACRAVGAANGRNPIAVVVPCHRVIASDGRLHGYGGGLWRKDWLLRHEGALPRDLFEQPGATLTA